MCTILQEKIELTNKFCKFQEDSELQILELKERLTKKEAEHIKIVEMLRQNHMEAQERERNNLIKKTKEEIELIKQAHVDEMQTLADKQEQNLQVF